jgi:hypothetical protein
MKSLLLAPLLALAAIASAEQRQPTWTLELETGVAATRYNSARVPKASGTDIDLASLVGRGWEGFGRVSLIYTDKAGGAWKLLYAPLRQTGTSSLPGPTSFAGQAFGAGSARAEYRFDSYRLTYRKPWKGGWSIGGTLKVRDAEIRLEQGGVRASESNVGLVPLLNIHGEGGIGQGFLYEFEMDGLAGGPGRAFDISLRLKRPISPQATAFVGFRVLEGGADVPRVKNFAWVSYLTVGASIRF